MLKDMVAIITGGNTGIGLAIAEKFAENGAKIAIVAINNNNAAEVIEKIESRGTECRVYVCDVTDYAAAQDTVGKIAADFGRVDILVNNAGITRDGLFVRMRESDFDSVINVNLKGTFNFSKAAGTAMFRQRSGNIISMASVIGIAGNAGQANYAASKAGIIGLTKSLAKELGARNINVNAIAPGFINTRMTEVLDEKVKEQMVSNLSIRRLGEPEDVANLALFLASKNAAYITGQVIAVDGGLRI